MDLSCRLPNFPAEVFLEGREQQNRCRHSSARIDAVSSAAFVFPRDGEFHFQDRGFYSTSSSPLQMASCLVLSAADGFLDANIAPELLHEAQAAVTAFMGTSCLYIYSTCVFFEQVLSRLWTRWYSPSWRQISTIVSSGPLGVLSVPAVRSSSSPLRGDSHGSCGSGPSWLRSCGSLSSRGPRQVGLEQLSCRTVLWPQECSVRWMSTVVPRLWLCVEVCTADFLDPGSYALNEYMDYIQGEEDRSFPADGCGHIEYHRRSLGRGTNVMFFSRAWHHDFCSRCGSTL